MNARFAEKWIGTGAKRRFVGGFTALLMLSVTAACGSSHSNASTGTGGNTTGATGGASASTAAAPQDLNLITSGQLLAATQSNQPPVAFLQNGQEVGAGIDIINAIAKKLNLTVHYKAVSFDAVIPAVAGKQYDIGALGILDTPAREKSVTFCEPWYYGHFSLLAKKKANISGMSALDGKTVAVLQGTVEQQYVTQNEPKAIEKVFSDQTAALAALEGGQVDAFFAGGSQVPQFLKEYSDLEQVTEVSSDQPNSFPVAKGNTALANAVNQELNAMFDDGTYAKIYKKWFPNDMIPTPLIKQHPKLAQYASASASAPAPSGSGS